MAGDIELRCRCGEIGGRLQGTTPNTCNRAICYCDDCQAFLRHVERADLFDDRGGTDLVQVAPSAVVYERGVERIVGVRLTPKGMYRWYANCCKTPLGNTVTPAVPFIGLPHEVLYGTPDAGARDAAFGKPRMASYTDSAWGAVDTSIPRAHFGHLLRVLWLVLGWKVRGKAWPNPFFEENARKPKYPLTILTPEERESLRKSCLARRTA